MDTIQIKYIFSWPDKDEQSYTVVLDANTLNSIDIHPVKKPDWSKLDYVQCPGCKLEIEDNPYCPLALKLVDINTLFSSLASYEDVHVEVITPERTISKNTTVQHAVSSLMGLIMPCSGCPDTQYFKPMARFHLPLATEQETIYRASSMYLLAQYFKYKEGQELDLELSGLNDIYSTLHNINTYCAKRLRYASQKTARWYRKACLSSCLSDLLL